MKSEFYVTLPSNASMDYFPQNTQSSYRTKLISPLLLKGEWEVGLSEIFIPRNWFNVGNHNNEYTIHLTTEKNVIVDNVTYDVTFEYNHAEAIEVFCIKLNELINSRIDTKNAVRFIPDATSENVTIFLEEGFELRILQAHAPTLLHMLHLPNADFIFTETISFNIRALPESSKQTLIIVNKNPTTKKTHMIPFTLIKKNGSVQKRGGLFYDIIKNIEVLGLQGYVTFTYEPIKSELMITVSNFAELHITEEKSQSLLRILNVQGNVVVKGERRFQINPLHAMEKEEFIELIVKEFPTVLKLVTEKKHLSLNDGMYKTAESLFREFQHIRLKQLPNQKVFLEVPKSCEVHFSNELGNMLGFDVKQFKSGRYISKYPLELDAGITEIFVYTDLIESHHVGDTYAPLLRIIPCMNEKKEQIVKQYDTPIYFSLRKNFVDTIQLELKTITGSNIIFTGGKTHALLSFRRREKKKKL